MDPTLDAEIVQVAKSELDKMYGDYKAKFGAHPAPDTDPTADQISGLKQLVATGALPYVDFSVWTPHGLRHLRKQVFTSHILNAATGEWTKKELPGPSDVDSWMRAYKTFRIAMVLMGAADTEHLEAYSDYIKDLSQQFGADAWGIIYKADCRMRSEYMERIRRALEENPAHGYSPASPWSAVFASAIREAEYWRKEVTTPATLLLARAKAPRTSGEDSDSDRRPRPGAGAKKKKREKQVARTTSRCSTRSRASTPRTGRASRSVSGSKSTTVAMARPSPSAPMVGRTSAICALDLTWHRSAKVRKERTDRRCRS